MTTLCEGLSGSDRGDVRRRVHLNRNNQNNNPHLPFEVKSRAVSVAHGTHREPLCQFDVAHLEELFLKPLHPLSVHSVRRPRVAKIGDLVVAR